MDDETDTKEQGVAHLCWKACFRKGSLGLIEWSSSHGLCSTIIQLRRIRRRREADQPRDAEMLGPMDASYFN